MYKEIFRWQKHVYEAIPVLPPESQKNFLGRIKELEKIDQETADKRMNEMFGSE